MSETEMRTPIPSLEASAPRCGNCRHWSDKRPSHGDMRPCIAISTAYEQSLYVPAGFGCVMHEDRHD